MTSEDRKFHDPRCTIETIHSVPLECRLPSVPAEGVQHSAWVKPTQEERELAEDSAHISDAEIELPPLDEQFHQQRELLRSDGRDDHELTRAVLHCRERQLREALHERDILQAQVRFTQDELREALATIRDLKGAK